MIYWLFTEGRELLSGFVVPLMCLTLIVPITVATLLGAGSADPMWSAALHRMD